MKKVILVIGLLAVMSVSQPRPRFEKILREDFTQPGERESHFVVIHDRETGQEIVCYSPETSYGCINEDGPKRKPSCSLKRLLQGVVLLLVGSILFFVFVRKADLNPRWNDALVIAFMGLCGLTVMFGAFRIITFCPS